MVEYNPTKKLTCGQQQHVAPASGFGDRGRHARLSRQPAVCAAELHSHHQAASPHVADGEFLCQRHNPL